jgi:hypothetical protein
MNTTASIFPKKSAGNSNYKLKLIFLSGTCLLILLKYMENLEYSGQKKLRKSILACKLNINSTTSNPNFHGKAGNRIKSKRTIKFRIKVEEE